MGHLTWEPGLQDVKKCIVSAKLQALYTWYRMEVSIFTGSSKGAWLSQTGMILIR